MIEIRTKAELSPLKAQEIALFFLDLPEKIRHCDWQNILSTDEVTKAKRFHFDKHRIRYVNAHLAKRFILAHYLETLPKTIEFFQGDYGKPYIKNNPDKWHFNLSHSANKALIGITKACEIGVDIEQIKDRELLLLAKRFFANHEAKAIENCQDGKTQQNLFFQVWSQKEAFIKAIGLGLRYPLEKFETPIFPSPKEEVTLDLEAKPWYISSRQLDDFAFAWCSQKKLKTDIFYQFNWEFIYG